MITATDGPNEPDPADFYTGIVADLYGPLKSTSQSFERYAAFIDAAGQPALELGCGDGEPLLDLVRRGYDIDGIDSSQDMLDRLRAEADIEGLPVRVFCQRMEQLDLPRRYRSIFLAGPTITLLPDDSTVRAALSAIRRHLTDDGTALVPLFIPTPPLAETVGAVKETTDSAGGILRVATIAQTRDDAARTQRTVLRYERQVGDHTDAEERPWVIHWHTPSGFQSLAAESGLRVEAVEQSAGVPGEMGSEWSLLLRVDGMSD